MKTNDTVQCKRQKSYGIRICLYKLTILGGVAFWVTSLATSLLPIAAKYRSAFTNWSVQSVWFGSLIAGIIIGCGVSYILLRFYPKIPAKGPIIKSVILSSIALFFAVILIDIPMIIHTTDDVIIYFLIGVVFNATRYLLLGISVGYGYKRLHG